MVDPTDLILIPRVGVVYFCTDKVGNPILEGTLNITAHNLLFYNEDTTVTVLYTLFEKIEKITLQDGARSQILIKTKTFKQYKFEIASQDEMDMTLESITKLSNIHELKNLKVFFPFLYHPRMKIECPPTYPWNGYSDLIARWECPPEKFIVSDANTSYSLCPSYPQEVVVPAICDRDLLTESARFRQGGRFPVISYYHKKTGASLLRSGQPMVGNSQKRCDWDKKLLNACLVNKQRGRIIDTRTKASVSLALPKGGGTEQPGMYPQWLLEYVGLDTATAMLESYEKMFKLCVETDGASVGQQWHATLSSTKWHTYIMNALMNASKIADFLDTDSSSVLVHGTNGTDNSLVLTSLTQLMLDPYTRRLEGFIELIIREWIFGGFPFRTRVTGLLISSKGRAPTFLLFLECVWQLWRQFARSFEFTEELLHLIHEHSNGSEYGTFTANSMKERSLFAMETSTCSLWAYVYSERERFVNPIFENNPKLLRPCFYPTNLVLWQDMFLKDPLLQEEKERCNQTVRNIAEKNKALIAEAKQLEEELFRLTKIDEEFDKNPEAILEFLKLHAEDPTNPEGAEASKSKKETEKSKEP